MIYQIALYLLMFFATSPLFCIDEATKIGFLKACERGDYDTVKTIFDQNSHDAKSLVNGSDNDRRTPLYHAIRLKNATLVNQLLQAGADSNFRSEDSKSYAYLAADLEYFDILKIILSKNPDLAAPDNQGNSPLHIAIQKNNIEIIKELLHHHADVNAQNNNGLTPLHVAAQKQSVEITKLLLAKTPDLSLLDKDGLKPLDYVQRLHSTEPKYYTQDSNRSNGNITYNATIAGLLKKQTKKPTTTTTTTTTTRIEVENIANSSSAWTRDSLSSDIDIFQDDVQACLSINADSKNGAAILGLCVLVTIIATAIKHGHGKLDFKVVQKNAKPKTVAYAPEEKKQKKTIITTTTTTTSA